jgi:HEPN domain-containing protein
MSAHKTNRPPGSPQDWLRHAESDLALASLALERQEILTEQVCFHAQQAAEKALKAVLIARQQRFPPVHDLEQLLEVARQAHLALPSWSDDLLDLTPYAVETRYPGYWEEITTAERDRALELATLTVEWASAQLGGEA